MLTQRHNASWCILSPCINVIPYTFRLKVFNAVMKLDMFSNRWCLRFSNLQGDIHHLVQYKVLSSQVSIITNRTNGQIYKTSTQVVTGTNCNMVTQQVIKKQILFIACIYSSIYNMLASITYHFMLAFIFAGHQAPLQLTPQCTSQHLPYFSPTSIHNPPPTPYQIHLSVTPGHCGCRKIDCLRGLNELMRQGFSSIPTGERWSLRAISCPVTIITSIPGPMISMLKAPWPGEGIQGISHTHQPHPWTMLYSPRFPPHSSHTVCPPLPTVSPLCGWMECSLPGVSQPHCSFPWGCTYTLCTESSIWGATRSWRRLQTGTMPRLVLMFPSWTDKGQWGTLRGFEVGFPQEH